MIVNASTMNGDSVDILYLAEIHHIVDNRFSYVYVEAIAAPQADTGEIVFFMHAPRLGNISEAREALLQSPLGAQLNRIFVEHSEDGFMRALQIFDDSETLHWAVESRHPLGSVDLIHESGRQKWWGLELSSHAVGQVRAGVCEDAIQPFSFARRDRHSWVANEPYVFRFGVFADRERFGFARHKRTLLRGLFLNEYCVHLGLGGRSSKTYANKDFGSRLWLRCHPETGLASVQARIADRQESMKLEESMIAIHTTIWLVLPSSMKIRQFSNRNRLVDVTGRVRRMPFGLVISDDKLNVYRWSPGDQGQRRTAATPLPANIASTAYLQTRTIWLRHHLGLGFLSAGGGAMIGVMTNDRAWAGLSWVVMFFSFEFIDLFLSRSEIAGWPRQGR